LPEGEMQVELLMKMKEKYCQAGHKIQHSAIQTNIKQAIHELGSNLYKNFIFLVKKELHEKKKFLLRQALKEVSDTMRLF
jgi:hypothetical protein